MSLVEDLDLDLKEYVRPTELEESDRFDSLSYDDKLSKLQQLVQKSQIYSQIILDNMLERSMEKKKKLEEERKNAQEQEKALVDGKEKANADTNHTDQEDKTVEGNEDVKSNDNQHANGSEENDSDVEITEVRRSTRLGRAVKRSREKKVAKPKRQPRRADKEKNTIKAKVSAETERTRKAIEAAQTGHNVHQPALVTGCVMKDYQLDGLEWLTSLYENGLNGILADEMGLGKTLQCIALFSFLIENDVDGPFLVVAPLSTVRNWGAEFSRFAPDIDVIEYVGYKDDRKRIKISGRMKKTVVVTTYELIIKDFRRFLRINWGYLTVDEGHRLKNFQSILIQFLKKLRCANRLLLTGTPLQNNLKELWSLLNFILPDIFHDLDLFERWFNFDELRETSSNDNKELQKAMNDKLQLEIIKSLHTVLKPFLLRRVKSNVIKDLPPKKEYIIYSDLQPLQKIMYNAAVNKNLPRKLTELYVKEYLLANETDLFSSPEDLAVIDALISKMEDKEVKSIKRARVNYLENNFDRTLDEIIGTDEDITDDDAPNEDYKHTPNITEPEDSRLKEISGDDIENSKNGDDANELSADSEAEDEYIFDDVLSNTRETSVENSPTQSSRKRTRHAQTQITVDDSGSDVEIIDDPSKEFTRPKRQAMLIRAAYRIAEDRVKHLRMKNRLMSLRLICGSHYSFYHPFSATDDVSDHERELSQLIYNHSGKVQLLDQLLTRLLNDKHKVLIFSQFTTNIDLLLTRLESKAISFSRIDGRVTIDDRKEEIERFSHNGENSSNVFLISTRAGGLGLNLIAADTVILFDNDWNPQMDLQAIDRVHRIGQTKPVKVFRFAVRDTVEEIIIMKSFNKRALEQMVIRLGDFQIGRVAKKLQDENIDISATDASKSLLSIVEKLNLQGFGDSTDLPDANTVLVGKDNTKRATLGDEELEELMDRSPECYTREMKEYPNLGSFESLNNLDG